MPSQIKQTVVAGMASQTSRFSRALAREVGQHNITVMTWRPVGPQQTIVTQDYYFSPDASEEFIADYLRFDHEVGGEDEVLIASVQEGRSSGAFARGRLLLDSERLIASFQRWLYEAVRYD